MNDFFEMDFLDLGKDVRGDAICIRYRIKGKLQIHVIDGGRSANSGEIILEHIDDYYDTRKIDNMVVTHNDNDHTDGLEMILEKCHVKNLWINKPWDYSSDMLGVVNFKRTADGIEKSLKKEFKNLKNLAKIAKRRGTTINKALTGTEIGEFTVISPSHSLFCHSIAESDCFKGYDETKLFELIESRKSKPSLVKAAWGIENLPEDAETSPTNEMSIIQYGKLCGFHILLTGDAGLKGLNDAVSHIPKVPLNDESQTLFVFQVPHHGSSNNVSSKLLNEILGKKLNSKAEYDGRRFSAYISAAESDGDHPRNEVIRAIIHRNGNVFTTENGTILIGKNEPDRGWDYIDSLDYPLTTEE